MSELITARIHRNDDRFGPCYDLLYKEFGTAELDTAERVAAALGPADAVAPQGFLIARFTVHYGRTQWHDPVGVIDGDYLPLPGGGGIGALGHLVIADHRRGEGHGDALVLAWERAVRTHARQHHDRLRLLLLESRPTAATFWARQGYRWVAGSEYRQPVINRPADPNHVGNSPIMELLMVKQPSASTGDVDTALLAEGVFTMYRHWYEPDCTHHRPDVWARITADLWGSTYPAFLSSLPGTPRTPLIQPPNHCTAAPTAA